MKNSSINYQDIPLVSICIPAYNAGATLRKTLDSVLSQDYPNLEIIVSDNHSTDDTAKIASEYANRGVRYALGPAYVERGYFCPGEHNWNYILGLASGQYIALYHADDLCSPTMVRRQVEFLQAHHDVSSVFTMTQMIDESDYPIRRGSTRLPDELRGISVFSFPEMFKAVLKYGNFIITPTLMTRKETLKAVGDFNYQRFYSAADLDLWFRMARWRPIGVIDEPLHKYRISLKQGSAKNNKLRTHVAHYFKAMDYYLEKSENQHLISKRSLNKYRSYKAADQVFCCVNLIMLGQMKEANELIEKAITWRGLYSACHSPSHFIQITFGIVLKLALKFGMGGVIGYFVDAVYHYYRAQKNSPI